MNGYERITLRDFRLEHERVIEGQVAYATSQDQKRALQFFENFIGGSTLLSKIKPRHAEAFIAHRLINVPSVNKLDSHKFLLPYFVLKAGIFF